MVLASYFFIKAAEKLKGKTVTSFSHKVMALFLQIVIISLVQRKTDGSVSCWGVKGSGMTMQAEARFE